MVLIKDGSTCFIRISEEILESYSIMALDWTSLTPLLIGQCLLSMAKEIVSLKQSNKGKDMHLVSWLFVPTGALRFYALVHMFQRSLDISFWNMVHDNVFLRALIQHSYEHWLRNLCNNNFNMSYMDSRHLLVVLSWHRSSGSTSSAPSRRFTLWISREISITWPGKTELISVLSLGHFIKFRGQDQGWYSLINTKHLPK
jgi:hypothetical protein